MRRQKKHNFRFALFLAITGFVIIAAVLFGFHKLVIEWSEIQDTVARVYLAICFGVSLLVAIMNIKFSIWYIRKYLSYLPKK